MNESLEQAKKEIEQKYKKIERSIFRGTIAGIILGVAVTIGSWGREMHQSTNFSKKYIDDPVVSKYENMVYTLNTLKKHKLDYESKKIVPYLKIGYNDIKKIKNSLDITINLLERDLQEIKQVPEIKGYTNYLNWKKGASDRAANIFGLGVGYISMSSIGGLSLLSLYYGRKEGKELKALEKSLEDEK